MNTFIELDLTTLVQRAQQGDRESFGRLVERFTGLVAAVARKHRRDPHEADELVQEVFLHAMRKIGQLRDPACFAGWLQRIAVRLLINRATRRPPMATLQSELVEQERISVDNPLAELMHREARDEVREAVANLRPLDRDVLVAFYLQSKPLLVIAEEFEIPLGTVKRRLHVARGRLESALRRSGRPVDPADAPSYSTADY